MNDDTITNQLVTRLADDIRAGRYATGDVLPPVGLLAKHARCSAHTVRRALRTLAQAGVVRGVQRRGTVVLRKPSLGRVSLLLSNDDHTNLLLQRLVCEALLDAGCDLDVIPAFDGARRVEDWCQRLLQEAVKPKCLVSLGARHLVGTDGRDAPAIVRAFLHRVLFLVDALPPTGSADTCVVLDLRAQARLVAEHLLRLGHRRVAVFAEVTPQPQGNSYFETIAGSCRDLIEVAGGQCHLHYGRDGLAGLLRLVREQGVTAFWDINDSQAVQKLAPLQAAGIRVPADLTLIGRNDTPWCRESVPPLTSVSLNPPAVARAIAGAVAAALTTGAAPPGQVLSVMPQLVVRASSAPPRQP